MNRTQRKVRSFLFVILAAVLILFAGNLLLRRTETPQHQGPDWAQVTLPGFSRILAGTLNQPVRLWFPGPNRELAPEDRTIHASDDSVDGMRQVLILLLAGPWTKGLFPLLPGEVALRELYDHQGIVLVDLAVPPAGGPAMGCFEEALALQSIQRTLKENFPEVQHIRFLLDGQERKTLAGHIALP
ncbi:MAG: GerMN domain-containing protein [Deltaproteobacteria bacterium]|nr:GerMN domain-containing protein [Deltaproteobacteria bacterium]